MRRWRSPARWSGARPRIATSKWWKEERHGVFIDYNQNAKDRTVAAAYSVRPKPDARVSAPLTWEEVDECDPADFTLTTMPARFASIGDRHARIDEQSVLARSVARALRETRRRGLGDAPWPPQYKKQPGEPTRVQPSRARTKTRPPLQRGRAHAEGSRLVHSDRAGNCCLEGVGSVESAAPRAGFPNTR